MGVPRILFALVFVVLDGPSRCHAMLIMPTAIHSMVEAPITPTTIQYLTEGKYFLHSATKLTSNQPYYLDGKSLLWNLLLVDEGGTDDKDENTQPPPDADAKAPLSFSSMMKLQHFSRDQVVRVLDENTVKLESSGLVSLAAIKTPIAGSSSTSYQFPECFSYSPTYKIRQLLPPKTEVWVHSVPSSSSSSRTTPTVIVREDDKLVVNKELVRTGFARIRGQNPVQDLLPPDELQSLQDQAKSKNLGLFKRCDEEEGNDGGTVVAEFEPLELTVQTVWGDDGGKQVLSRRETTQGKDPPKNPGDSKGCSDFGTYEDALKWFEYYRPYYGDVAKLDRNGDGIPCPGLPHTTVREQYRMRIPTSKPNSELSD